VSIDRTVVAHAELFENDARDEEALHAFLDFVRELDRTLAADGLDEAARFIMQAGVGRVGNDVVQV
jgi:hypothetical protein